MEWKIILLSVALMGFMVAGLAIKLLVKKDGKFAGTCASQSPYLNENGEACSLCGAKPNEPCKN